MLQLLKIVTGGNTYYVSPARIRFVRQRAFNNISNVEYLSATDNPGGSATAATYAGTATDFASFITYSSATAPS